MYKYISLDFFFQHSNFLEKCHCLTLLASSIWNWWPWTLPLFRAYFIYNLSSHWLRIWIVRVTLHRLVGIVYHSLPETVQRFGDSSPALWPLITPRWHWPSLGHRHSSWFWLEAPDGGYVGLGGPWRGVNEHRVWRNPRAIHATWHVHWNTCLLEKPGPSWGACWARPGVRSAKPWPPWTRARAGHLPPWPAVTTATWGVW